MPVNTFVPRQVRCECYAMTTAKLGMCSLRRVNLWKSLQSPVRLRRLHRPFQRPYRAFATPRAYSASSKEKEELLRGVSVESREDVARILEQAQKADATWTTVYTDFYPPPVISEAVSVIKRMTGVECKAWGGYPQAERTRLVVNKADMPEAEDTQMNAVHAIKVKGNFMFDAANHRDFLGACMGCGIERSKVGDILVQGEQGAQILLVPELVPHLEMQLTQVRSVPVTTTNMELSELAVKELKVVQMRTVEASLRLDAIASAGFRTSRSRIVEMIKKGDIRLNWKDAKASALVAPGDMISCAGKGRVEITEVDVTKKDRYAVQLVRYV